MRSRDIAEAKPRRTRGAISPTSIVASLVISRIVCLARILFYVTSVRIRVFMRTLESNLVFIMILVHCP